MKMIIYFAAVLFLLFNYRASLHAQWIHTGGPNGRAGIVFSICANDKDIIACTGQELYISDTNHPGWISISPDILPEEGFYSVESAEGNLYVAGYHLLISPDKGKTWTIIDSSEVRGINRIISNEKYLFGYSYSWSTFYRFQDEGLKWSLIDSIQNVNSIAIHDSLVLVIDNSVVYRSTDWGKTWQNVYSYPPNPESYDPAVIALSDSHAIIGTGNIVHFSADRGKTWQDNIAGINCTNIFALEFSPPTYQTDFIFAGTDSGVYRSGDDGESWIKMDNGLDRNQIYSLAFREPGQAEKPVLYTGTDAGLFQSNDLGESWNAIGFPSGYRELISAGPYLFAGSYSQYREGEESVFFRKYIDMEVHCRIGSRLIMDLMMRGFIDSKNLQLCKKVLVNSRSLPSLMMHSPDMTPCFIRIITETTGKK